MKIALAQMNPTTGDISGNLEGALTFAAEAAEGGASLVVFPPYALSGFIEGPLASYEPFLHAFDLALEDFARRTPLPAIIGGPVSHFAQVLEADDVPGVESGASALFYCDGHSPLLLTFEGARSPLRTIELLGEKVVCSLGSHLLDTCGDSEDVSLFIRFLLSNYADTDCASLPSFRTADATPEASALAKRLDTPLVDMRLVGAQDTEVFTGGSSLHSSTGRCMAALSLFESDFVIIDSHSTTRPQESPLAFDETAVLCSALVSSIRDYWHKNGLSDCAVGLSGGIDSAVVASLCVRALGPNHVHGVLMPSKVSSEGSIVDAEALASNLGLDTRIIPITDAVDCLCDILAQPCGGAVNGLALENLQSRMRTVYLMTICNQMGWALVNTGNKSEAAMGFSTLYGDTAGAFAPLSDCYKRRVYELARHMNEREEIIPRAVIDKAPSAELYEGATDEDRLPPYDVLDEVLERHLEDGQGFEQLVSAGFDAETVFDVLASITRSEFKRRQEPLGPRVTSCSFIERNWPVSNRFIDKGASNR